MKKFHCWTQRFNASSTINLLLKFISFPGILFYRSFFTSPLVSILLRQLSHFYLTTSLARMAEDVDFFAFAIEFREKKGAMERKNKQLNFFHKRKKNRIYFQLIWKKVVFLSFFALQLFNVFFLLLVSEVVLCAFYESMVLTDAWKESFVGSN